MTNEEVVCVFIALSSLTSGTAVPMLLKPYALRVAIVLVQLRVF